MTLDMEKVQVELDALNTLADEYRRCEMDPPLYAHSQGLIPPHTTAWVQWSEETRESLAADLEIRAGRLAVLLGVPGVQRG